MTLWGGRFAQELDLRAWDLNTSLPVDKRLAIQDVEGSRAWADAIHRAGILSDKEHASICPGTCHGRRGIFCGTIYPSRPLMKIFIPP